MIATLFAREKQVCDLFSQVDEKEAGTNQELSERQDAPRSMLFLDKWEK
jgi:hypothetical protein